MANSLRSILLTLPLVCCGARAAEPAKSLAESVPGGAIAFLEASDLAELISKVRGSEVLMAALASDELVQMMAGGVLKDLTDARKYAEFVLRMSIWEASEKLLDGQIAAAAYPDGIGEDPNVVMLIKPSGPNDWLRKRIRFAPLVRAALKRIERREFGDAVHVYRERGFRKKAIHLALSESWIVATNSLELLKSTVAYQLPPREGREPPAPLARDVPFKSMTGRMGERHMGRVFVSTGRIDEATGDNLGLPKKIDDPVLGLFLSGVVELLGQSDFAGFTLDIGEKEMLFKAGIDVKPEDLSEQYRLFFSGAAEDGIEPPPAVAGFIGGFSLYRPFGDWYRKRDSTVQNALIPGMAGFEGSVGDLLLTPDGDRPSIVGDNVRFVAAHATDAGTDSVGVKLPGFAFVVDLARPEDADAAMKRVFDAMLAELRKDKNLPGGPWRQAVERHSGVTVNFATRELPEGAQPMIPASARVGDRYLISSSRQVCRKLIDWELAERGGDDVLKHRDLIFDLDFTELEEFFSANKSEYLKEFARGTSDPAKAAEDYGHVANLLQALSSIRGESSAEGGNFELTIRGELR